MLKLRQWIQYIQGGRLAQWEPTPNILLRTFPNLTRIFQPQIRQALLGLPGALGLAGLAGIAPGGEGGGAIDPDEYMPERPLGQE